MNLDELRPVLAAYRKQVETAWSPATAHPDYDGKAGDPAGQCGVTSAWLQRRLREDHGIGSTFVVGDLCVARDGIVHRKHCWLQLDTTEVDVVVDLTADQLHGFEDCQVICETNDALLADGVEYVEFATLTEEQVSRDPVASRLALLEEALS